MKHLSYRKDIDGLRAVAVLAVVIFHYFPKILRGGFFGVDIFFVISGFLISNIILRSLEANNFSFIDFYSRRIKRIFPALIAILLFCIVAGWLFLLPDEYSMLGKHIVYSTFFATNISLLQESGYFDFSSNSKPLLHLWSLGVEEQYYLFWPIILIFIYRTKALLLPAILIFITISFILSFGTNKDLAFFAPHTRLWELTVGALAAYIQIHKKEIYQSRYLHKITSKKFDYISLQKTCSILALLMLVIALRHKRFDHYGLLLTITGTFLLISLESKAFINEKILSNKSMIYIGLISYPLYLWHWPILVMLSLYKENITNIDRLIAVLISFILSCATYEFLEKKLRHTKNRSVIIILLAVFATIGFIGFLIYKNNGFYGRFKQELLPIIQLKANSKEVKYEKCLLNDKNQDSSSFSKSCLDEGDKPLIFLWGDSHSAHLYPGLLNLQKHGGDFRLGQFNIGSCPPILDKDFNKFGNKFCAANNNYVFNKILSSKPDNVILSFSLAALSHQDLYKLNDTIQLLKKNKIKKITLIGTMPLYQIYTGKEQGNFKKFLLKISKDNGLAKRNKIGISNLEEEEMILKTIAQQNGITYISMIDLLCNKEGCIITTDERGQDILTYDGGHLTTSGSIFVINSISQIILPQNQKQKGVTRELQ